MGALAGPSSTRTSNSSSELHEFVSCPRLRATILPLFSPRIDRRFDEFAEGSVVRGFEAAGALEEGDRFFSEQTRHVAEADASEGSVAFLGLLEDRGADAHHANAEAADHVIDQQVEVAGVDDDVQRVQDACVAELLVELRATVRSGARQDERLLGNRLDRSIVAIRSAKVRYFAERKATFGRSGP